MKSVRYIRWQGLAITQLSVAIALISGLSIAGLSAGLTLLRDSNFSPCGWWKCAFGVSQFLFVMAAVLSCSSVITRALDFRLTARIVRKDEQPDYNKSLTIFCCDAEGYGRATWRLFWSSCIALLFGAALLIAVVAVAFGNRLH